MFYIVTTNPLDRYDRIKDKIWTRNAKFFVKRWEGRKIKFGSFDLDSRIFYVAWSVLKTSMASVSLRICRNIVFLSTHLSSISLNSVTSRRPSSKIGSCRFDRYLLIIRNLFQNSMTSRCDFNFTYKFQTNHSHLLKLIWVIIIRFFYIYISFKWLKVLFIHDDLWLGCLLVTVPIATNNSIAMNLRLAPPPRILNSTESSVFDLSGIRCK